MFVSNLAWKLTVLLGAAVATGWSMRVYRTGVIIANKTAITAKPSLKLLLKREKSTPENTLINKSLLGVLLVPRLIAVVVCFTFADVCDYFKFYGF